jgi:hypothetical protein
MKKYLIPILAILILLGVVAAVINYNRNVKPSNTAVTGPSSLTISELGIKFKLPDNLRDATYKMGNGPETEQAADFSSPRLAAAGGESCTAGNHVGVSSYPLGEVVVSEETPDKVAAEIKENPDDGLGDFITKVSDDKYVYYMPAPAEPCSQDSQAQQLQTEGAAALKRALKTAELTGSPPKETKSDNN